MDDRTLRVLEYDKIKAMLASHAACSLGKGRALTLEPRADVAWVRDRLAETSEACVSETDSSERAADGLVPPAACSGAVAARSSRSM